MMQCHRSIGLSCRNCRMCRVDGGGWLRCPASNTPTYYMTHGEQQVMKKALYASSTLVAKGFTGDICADCGSMAMIRTGVCLTCQSCGSSSGGCS
jgi:hypothetical protein